MDLYSDLVHEAVVTHCAVPPIPSHHIVLHIHHAGSSRLQQHHIETLAGEVVTGDKRSVLTLGEVAGLTAVRVREEEEEKEEEEMGRGEHRRTEEKEERKRRLLTVNLSQKVS